HLAADRVHLRGDLQRGAPARPLEQQVLEVVGRARVREVLVTRADAHPDTQCYRAHRRKELRDDPEAAREYRPADVDRVGRHLLVVSLPAGAVPGPAMAVAVAAPVPAVPAIAAVTVARAAVAAGLARAVRDAAGQVLARRLALQHLDGHQAQLAAVVHFADLDLDLVADVHHVVDVLDPLAAVQLADLRDVQQAVLAGQQADERAERRGLDDRAEEALAHLGHVRVRDRVDRGPGRLRGRAVGRADVDRAVVLDGDLGAGVVLDRVDHLALRADDLADLVDRDLDRDDQRRVRG